MKKLICIGIVFLAIIGMSSCNYDDSNDIDIIMPGDTTTNGFVPYSKKIGQ
ncbi:MAG: hypothetical protein MUO53_07820 [Maribacter sp.]|nr:hypothetical protein [Maribacter sp.]